MMIFRVTRGALLAAVLSVAAACGVTGPEAERGSRADRVFVMAAEGDSTAQTALGLLYERGIGVARDPALALVWYRRAAAQGDALAEFHIGSLYERGDGIALDYAEAAKWYQRASDKGNESAQAALAYLYDRGLGVDRDFAEAEALYGQASASWAADETFPAEATFATGREGVALANPSSDILAAPLGERRPEFVAGKEEAPAIEIDLAALNDAPSPPPPATVFDGPEPIAGRGENFPLASQTLARPEAVRVPEPNEPPGNTPMGAVDVEDSLKPLPPRPKPRPPARVPPPEDLPAVHLQSPDGETAPSESGADEGLLIAGEPEPERTVLMVEDLLDEEVPPAEAPVTMQVETVAEDKVYSLDAALNEKAAEADARQDLEAVPPPEVPLVEQAMVEQTEVPAENVAENVAPVMEQPKAGAENQLSALDAALEVETDAPIETPAVEPAEQVAEDEVARLDAALDAEGAAFDAELAPDTTDADDDILPPLPPEPEIFLISLATYESEAAALEAWEIISTTHAGLLRNLPFEFQPIEVAAPDGEGTAQYVELIVGPLDTPLKSRTLCAALRAHDHVCRTIER